MLAVAIAAAASVSLVQEIMSVHLLPVAAHALASYRWAAGSFTGAIYRPILLVLSAIWSRPIAIGPVFRDLFVVSFVASATVSYAIVVFEDISWWRDRLAIAFFCALWALTLVGLVFAASEIANAIRTRGRVAKDFLFGAATVAAATTTVLVLSVSRL
jgi:hypothetical protein